MADEKKTKPEGSGKLRALTDQEKEWLIEDIFACEQTAVSIRRIPEWRGIRDYNRYLKQNPSFAAAIEQAKIDRLQFIENLILNIEKTPAGAKRDDKTARIKLDAYLKVLQFGDPGKYGNKVDINLNQNISIRANLDESKKRVLEMMKEVGPLVLPEKRERKKIIPRLWEYS